MFNREKLDAALDGIARVGSSGMRTAGPRVLVLRDDSDTVSEGGIIIPDQAQRNERVGTVLALGTLFDAQKAEYGLDELKIGDRVSFNVYDGVSLSVDTRLGEVEILTFHLGNLYNYWTP